MSTENILFQDIFDIKDLDPQGKRFDRGIKKRNVWDLVFNMQQFHVLLHVPKIMKWTWHSTSILKFIP